MKAKWHLSAFLIILTILGISLQQFSVPNQEIVVQFVNDEVTLLETQNTIAIVKKQLQNIGVENIQVHKEDNGILKITYFSDVDVASIKKIFSKEKELKLAFTFYHKENPAKEPSNKNSNTYKLDIFEIQKTNDTDGDFNGYALELIPENDRFLNTTLYFSSNEIDVKKKNRVEKVAYKVHKKIAIAIDNSSHNIPEVRAGPVARLIS